MGIVLTAPDNKNRSLNTYTIFLIQFVPLCKTRQHYIHMSQGRNLFLFITTDKKKRRGKLMSVSSMEWSALHIPTQENYNFNNI